MGETTHSGPVSDPKTNNNLLPGTLASDGVGQIEGTEGWQKALDVVVNSCVVLRITMNRSFDTESATSSYATGFVVDDKRGIILTNRHVVTPGPTTCEAVFLNREELPVWPLYYDPVHDFGFLRFDPKQLQFMKSGKIELDPAAARVGMEVRVVGNDSGEKLSILSGTLARLDRDAPHYTRHGFNDFNTFYLQAASGTKGGSSGSPVINSLGHAIGLNAGGKNKAASAFYLPLHRPARALKVLQEALGEEAGKWDARRITRGDLQTTFLFKGFEEVRRLGLQRDTEAAVRAADLPNTPGLGGDQHTGMLVVESVLPGGPADGCLQPGDVLVRLNGEIMTSFLPLEAALDDSVGQKVKLDIERAGVPSSFDLTVQDLHDVTPSTFLEMAGGVVHALSYQQARNMSMEAGSVYVAETGFLLERAQVPKSAIITSLDRRPTPCLEAFCAVLGSLQDGSRATLQYRTSSERRRPVTVVVHIDWRWYGKPVLWRRNDAEGTWDREANYAGSGEAAAAAALPPRPAPSPAPSLQAPLPGLSPAPSMAAPEATAAEAEPPGVSPRAAAALDAAEVGALLHAATTDVELSDEAYENRLRSCMVQLEVDLPVVALPDGVHATSFRGAGLIVYVDEEVGLVLTDRNTVCVTPGDINITFCAYPSEAPGRVRFMHPLHNWAIVSFDTSKLSSEARKLIKKAEFAGQDVRRGDRVWLAGPNAGHAIVRRRSTVVSATHSVAVAHPQVPRFRAVHEECIKLDMDFGTAVSGVLTDGRARMLAFWGSYSEQVRREEEEWMAGIPARSFAPWIRRLAPLLRRQPSLYGAPGSSLPLPSGAEISVLDAELRPLGLAKAAHHGLPPEWVSRLAAADPERRQVLQVRSTVAGSDAQEKLKAGDLLLEVAGRAASNFPALDAVLADLQPPSPRRRPSFSAQPFATGKRAAEGTASEPAAKRARDEDGKANGTQQLEPQRSISAFSQQAAAAAGDTQQLEVPLTICREGQQMEVSVRLGLEDGLGTTRLVHFCGAQFQEPHRAVRELGYLPPEGGVFISRWHHGSPAHRYGLFGLHWLTELGGKPTPDLDTFVAVARNLPDQTFVRCVLVELHSAKRKVLSVKTDLRYWPCWQLRLDPDTSEWHREMLSPQ